MATKRTTKNTPADTGVVKGFPEHWHGRVVVGVPGMADMTRIMLARLIEVRDQPPMNRLSDARFAELVQSANEWIAKADEIQEQAKAGGVVLDAYWLYCREAQRAIYTARDEPFAQAGSRQRKASVGNASKLRGNSEIEDCIARAKAAGGTVKEQFQRLRNELENAGFVLRDVATKAGNPAIEIDLPDKPIRIALKTLANRYSR